MKKKKRITIRGFEAMNIRHFTLKGKVIQDKFSDYQKITPEEAGVKILEGEMLSPSNWTGYRHYEKCLVVIFPNGKVHIV